MIACCLRTRHLWLKFIKSVWASRTINYVFESSLCLNLNIDRIGNKINLKSVSSCWKCRFEWYKNFGSNQWYIVEHEIQKAIAGKLRTAIYLFINVLKDWRIKVIPKQRANQRREAKEAINHVEKIKRWNIKNNSSAGVIVLVLYHSNGQYHNINANSMVNRCNKRWE